MRYGCWRGWRNSNIKSEDVKDSDIVKFWVAPVNDGDRHLADFPVGHYTVEEQRARAEEYADYVNMQEQAKEEAVKQITITTAVAKRLATP